MEAAGRYLVAVAGASLISGIVLSFVRDTAHRSLVKLICGIFLLLTVIRPLADVSLTQLSPFALPYREEARQITAQGEDYALVQLRELIKDQAEAYILDKAAELDASVSVRVELSMDSLPVPVSVTVSGSISPYSKKILQNVIAGELGIAKEDQIWTGQGLPIPP